MDKTQEEKDLIKKKIEQLKNSKFKQQTLASWRPVPTTLNTFVIFTVFSVLFLTSGIIMYLLSDQILELEKGYNVDCEDYLPNGKFKGEFCVIEF